MGLDSNQIQHFLESTYHALKALLELDNNPKNIHKCERFVYSCMTRVCVFGRKTITVPINEILNYAFINLKIIDKMKKVVD